MSWVRMLANGAGEAIKLVPLVFTLGFAPAHAHLPRPVPVQEIEPGPAPLLQAVADSPTPTLIAQHFALALSDTGSQVRATSVFRNDTHAPIAARYMLPLAGTVILHGMDADADDLDDADFTGCGSDDDSDAADESADAAQFIEAGEARSLDVQTGLVWLEPGDEVTLVSVRPADLIKRDSRRRLVLVLPAAPPGQAAPQFSAEVEVDATQPIVALGSATHGGDVDGLGGSRARLFIPNGRVYEARFLSVDFQLGTVQQEVARHWGNEDRLPIAAR